MERVFLGIEAVLGEVGNKVTGHQMSRDPTAEIIFLGEWRDNLHVYNVFYLLFDL